MEDLDSDEEFGESEMDEMSEQEIEELERMEQ